MSVLGKVRGLLIKGKTFHLLDNDSNTTDDIKNSVSLKFDGENEVFALDTVTEFVVNGNALTLRVVIHCWIHKDSTAAEYLADCQAKEITNVSFLHRSDLIQWLTGKSSASSYIGGGKDAESKALATSGKKAENKEVNEKISLQQNHEVRLEKLRKVDPLLFEAVSEERTLLDHNTEMRGSKPIDFRYLIKDAELKVVQSIKASLRSSKKQSGSHQNGISKNSSTRSVTKKDPIILIPSAASSIFTMKNIKQFLQDSQYIDSRTITANLTQEIITLEKKFDNISKPIRFIIVNNTRMFTKPEYWDRVVAVFTTGHEWQFDNYQWNKPQELFQHCKGYCFHFAGDSVPQTVQQWNVQKIEIDKNKRFKDVEVVRHFWYNLERELQARGYN